MDDNKDLLKSLGMVTKEISKDKFPRILQKRKAATDAMLDKQMSLLKLPTAGEFKNNG